jgi:benzoylformate decarboxylase
VPLDPSKPARAVDVLLEILRDEGATTIFGNPGSTEMPLMDALVDAPDFRYVLGLQEATAVAMADGYALKTGRPAFVNLHAAGGLGNAMGVLVASKASETPLVVTAGQQDTRHLFSDPWLAGDLVALAKPVAKWATEVRRGADVGAAVRRAFAIAATPPQGPVFLSLPMDVLDQEVEPRIPAKSRLAARAPSPGAGDLARRLAAHDPARVAVLIGDDVPADAAAGAVALAHAGGYVVYGAQLTSRAAFPAHDPCWGGMLKPDFAAIREKLADADAVLMIGGRAFVAYPYREERPIPESASFYHVAGTPEAIGREFPADFAVTGDVGATLEEAAAVLAAAVERRGAAQRVKKLGERKAQAERAARAAIMAESAARPVTPDLAVLSVLDALPPGALIANDSAATFGRVQSIMRTEPGHYFFSRGGVLGCAMPAATGIGLVHEGWVACLCGDGGAMYSPQALWSAAHYKSRVIFFVFNNARYNVLMNVAKGLGSKNAVAGKFVGMDVVEPRIDFQALARSMGVPGVRADDPAAIAAAIAEATTRDGPSLIEIAIA